MSLGDLLTALHIKKKATSYLEKKRYIDDPCRVEAIEKRKNEIIFQVWEVRPWEKIKNAELKLLAKILNIEKFIEDDDFKEAYPDATSAEIELHSIWEPPEKIKKLLKEHKIKFIKENQEPNEKNGADIVTWIDDNHCAYITYKEPNRLVFYIDVVPKRTPKKTTESSDEKEELLAVVQGETCDRIEKLPDGTVRRIEVKTSENKLKSEHDGDYEEYLKELAELAKQNGQKPVLHVIEGIKDPNLLKTIKKFGIELIG